MKIQLRYLSASFYADRRRRHCRSHFSISAVALLCSLLSGCSNFGAPEFMVLDSYFPIWMLCTALGIIAAIVARVIFVRLGLDAMLPFRLFIYTCLALIVACTLYLLLSVR